MKLQRIETPEWTLTLTHQELLDLRQYLVFAGSHQGMSKSTKDKIADFRRGLFE